MRQFTTFVISAVFLSNLHIPPANAEAVNTSRSDRLANRLREQVNFQISSRSPRELNPFILPYATCKLAPYWRRPGGKRLDRHDSFTAQDCSALRSNAQRLSEQELVRLGITAPEDREEIVSNSLLAVDLQADFMFAWTTRKK